jgi:hypothetical protein
MQCVPNRRTSRKTRFLSTAFLRLMLTTLHKRLGYEYPSMTAKCFNISGVTLIRSRVHYQQDMHLHPPRATCGMHSVYLPCTALLFGQPAIILTSFFLVHLLTCFLHQHSSCVSTFHADVKDSKLVEGPRFELGLHGSKP